MPHNNQLEIAEVDLLLMEKQTSLASIRTALALMVVPMSLLTVLITTSSLWNWTEEVSLVLSLLVLCISLIVPALYLIWKSMNQIHRYDGKIQTLRASSPILSSLVDAE